MADLSSIKSGSRTWSNMTVLVSKQKSFQVLSICKIFSILEKRMSKSSAGCTRNCHDYSKSNNWQKKRHLKQSRLLIGPESWVSKKNLVIIPRFPRYVAKTHYGDTERKSKANVRDVSPMFSNTTWAGLAMYYLIQFRFESSLCNVLSKIPFSTRGAKELLKQNRLTYL